MTHFIDGDTFEVSGLHFRVVRGSKSPDDLRLEWSTGGQWWPVHMAAVALMADFFYENEDRLYPPPRYRGGRYFLDYLYESVIKGWERADLKLRLEKRGAALQRQLTEERIAAES